MKRFIRTCTSIIDASNYNATSTMNGIILLRSKRNDEEGIILLKPEMIEDESDELTDVIDEFVYDHECICLYANNTWRYLHDDASDKHTIKDDMSIYGAIWVDGPHGEPCLKSIAKKIGASDFKLLTYGVK